VRRLLPLILLVLIPAPSAALADGCPLPCSGQSSSPPGSKFLYVQPDGPGGPMLAYDTATRQPVMEFEPGIASADGRLYFSTFHQRHRTRLLRSKVSTGTNAGSRFVNGYWNLGAVSASGERVALVRNRRDETTVQVFDFAKGRTLHVLRLRGFFEVEALSPDGQHLFLIQHLAQRRYLVRQYDLRHERLVARPLRAPGVKLMAGYAWSGVASRDGEWLLTLYLSTARQTAFVHSLNLAERRPACVLLPSGRGVFKQLKRYSMTLAPGKKTLYAANPLLGVVAEIDLDRSKVVRVSRFQRATKAPAGHSATLSTISRNSRTLYFSAGRDLWAYDAAYGLIRGPYATGGRVVGVGYGAKDRRIFAVRADGKMLAFNAATGARIG
jgi:outer membrane protein assembly factor BamB